MHGLTGNLGRAAAPVIFDWLFIQRDKLRTHVVPRATEGAVEHDLAFMKLPVVWWCFGFFLLSTMTLAVVQSFSVSILKAMHGVSFEAAPHSI